MPLLDPRKVHRATEHSDTVLQPFREKYAQALANYGGMHWGNPKAGVPQPLNLTHRYVNVIASHLAAGNPKHDVRTQRMQLRPHALLESLALDHLGNEINRVKTTRDMILMALLGPCAYCRVGLRVGSNTRTIRGITYDLGQPYIQPISFDDLIIDPAGRCREEFMFEGYRYRSWRENWLNLPKGELTEYGASVIEKIPGLGSDGQIDMREGERVNNEVTAQDRFDLVDTIELMDLVIYDEGRSWVVTMSTNKDHCEDYLQIREWNGPGMGPLERLEFDPVPFQRFGVQPVARAWEQADLANEMLDKISEQMKQLKVILAYRKSAKDEAEQIKDAPSGSMIGVRELSDVAALPFDTTNPQIMPFLQMMTGFWDMATGHVDVLGGGDAQADTATEYSGRQANAGVAINDMNRVLEAHESRVSGKLAWYGRKDPFMQKALLKRLPGGEFFEVAYTPEQREGDFEDFTYKVRNLSMSSLHNDPQVRQRRIVELMQTAVLLAEAEQTTGGMVKAAAALRVCAREYDIEELDEIVQEPGFQQMLGWLAQQGPQPTGPGTPVGVSGMPSRIQVSDRQTSAIGTVRSAMHTGPRRAAHVGGM